MKHIMKVFATFIVAVILTFTCFGNSRPVIIHADNSTAETAATLRLNGNWVNSSLEDFESIDWYKVTLPSDGFLTLTAKSSIESCTIEIYNFDTTHEYTYFYAGGSEKDPGTQSKTVPLDSGVYLVKVRAFPYTGDYQIRATFEAANNNEGHGNRSINTAMNLASGKTVKGFISLDDNLVDFYKITLHQTEDVDFKWKAEMGGTALIVYNADQSETLVHEDIYGDGPNNPAIKTVAKTLNAGTYIITISTVNNSYYGRYNLTVTYPSVANAVTMYRAYNPNSGEHFYTSNTKEFNHIVSLGWKNEGVGWIAPKESKTPVYRLYNANGGEHHYTMSEKEKDTLVSRGWKDEGIGWYSDDYQRTPLYRQYNPNAFANNHNYTTSKKENDSLVKLGWKSEGIGWYGVRAK